MPKTRSDIERRTPLAGNEIITDGFRAFESSFRERWSLRADDEIALRLGHALDIDLSGKMLAAIRYNSISSLRLSPDEWLILSESNDGKLEERVSRCDVQGASLVDISNRQTGIHLEGQACETVLSVFCPLDFNLATFPIDAATRTVFGRSEIVIWRKAQDAFHVEVWRSFADYVWQSVERAARDI